MNPVEQAEIDIDVKADAHIGINQTEEEIARYLTQFLRVPGGDDVGGGEVVVKEEEVEEVVEEVDVGVKRKAEEETEPGKTKKKWVGCGYVWTEEEDDALLKGAGKYGLDFKQIRENNGKVLGDRTPIALRNRLKRQYPEKFKELRAINPVRGTPWTTEEVEALKRGMKKYGKDWDEIHKSENKILGRRTLAALKKRYQKHLK
ncbi:hypothetical protein TrST_g4517 [Triparma strigata]|uniref:Uncharacterized protein n=1 Tax=Triparma strigata TaxID=1606541 RepID=A0A9W7DXW2_9STRA|nr:hypothetical protein TrST_g4517 [Triparma strigata]